MEIKDVKPNQGNVDLVAEVVELEEPRSFEKFGKVGKVCNAKLKDVTGEIKLTLWNDDIERVKLGDKVHLENGWCSEYKGERQLSPGKFGKIEVVEGQPTESQPTEVFTNDPKMLQPASTMEESPEGEEGLENFDEEEVVE